MLCYHCVRDIKPDHVAMKFYHKYTPEQFAEMIRQGKTMPDPDCVVCVKCSYKPIPGTFPETAH